MATTHTTERWTVDQNEELPVAVIEDTEDGLGVCELGPRTPLNLKRATLIASAPSLLSALKKLVGPKRHTSTCHCLDCAAQDEARQAIRQATGD